MKKIFPILTHYQLDENNFKHLYYALRVIAQSKDYGVPIEIDYDFNDDPNLNLKEYAVKIIENMQVERVFEDLYDKNLSYNQIQQFSDVSWYEWHELTVPVGFTLEFQHLFTGTLQDGNSEIITVYVDEPVKLGLLFDKVIVQFKEVKGIEPEYIFEAIHKNVFINIINDDDIAYLEECCGSKASWIRNSSIFMNTKL